MASLVAALWGCAPPESFHPGGYAIVYGVSDYGSTINALPYPAVDAADMAAMLEDQGYQVRLRVDSDATTANLFADIEWAAAGIAVDIAAGLADSDGFVFYFAGHGIGSGTDDRYPADLLAALDAASSGGKRSTFLFFHPNVGSVSTTWSEIVADQAVSERALRAALFAPESPATQAVESRRSVIVIDACHAGGFIEPGDGYDATPLDYRGAGRGISASDALSAFSLTFDSWGAADRPERSAIVLAAAGAYEYAWEDSRLGNGIFTHYFLETPRYADRDQDGWITVTEAYNHTVDRVNDYWNSRVTGSDRYLPRMSGGPSEFVLFARR